MLAYLPKNFSSAQVPSSIEVEVFDGDVDQQPSSLDRVEIYVPTYMGSNAVYEIIREMPNLRYIQLLTAGVDKVTPLVRDGITLCNARGVHDLGTAEHTLGLILSSMRGIVETARAGGEGWRTRRIRPTLLNSEVTIVGAGSIGREIGRLIEALGGKVSFVSRSGSGGTTAFGDADRLFRSADVIVAVVPLTIETKSLFDASFFSKVKVGALFVNVARGEVVDQGAMVDALRIGRFNAALDVVTPEPLPSDSELWTMPNVIITPHVGGATKSFFYKGIALIEENFSRFARGEELLNVIKGDY
ncbi:MAG: NAD(P)-dependent oxidoreductase [Actinomycetota bacterium]|nr:NAD(P)-dependent oxidoreductase [Actinomycetota bacterium]